MSIQYQITHTHKKKRRARYRCNFGSMQFAERFSFCNYRTLKSSANPWNCAHKWLATLPYSRVRRFHAAKEKLDAVSAFASKYVNHRQVMIVGTSRGRGFFSATRLTVATRQTFTFSLTTTCKCVNSTTRAPHGAQLTTVPT